MSTFYLEAVLYNTLNCLNIQRVLATKKPPCIRKGSKFSYKSMDKTISYCSKAIACTRESGFLFGGTRRTQSDNCPA